MTEPTPDAKAPPRRRATRVKTPTILQMEALECGAAALAIVLAYHRRFVPLEEMRIECGVSRDGSKAVNMLRAARRYGFEARGFTKEPAGLRSMPVPMIAFWNFNHFVVVEGFKHGRVYLNDPASGRRSVADEEFDTSFTGVVLTFEKTAAFRRGGDKPGFLPGLVKRLRGSEAPILYAVILGVALVIPGLVIPTFSRLFVDNILVGNLQSWVRPLLLGMAVAAVLRGLMTWLQQACLKRLEAKVALSSASGFLAHVLRLPMEFFYQRFPGEVGMRVQINDRVAKLVSGEFATTVISLVTIVFYGVVMLAYDVVLTAVAVMFVLLNVAALRYVSRRRVDENKKLQRSRAQLLALSMGGLQMMEDLKATGSEADFFADWSGRYANAMNAEQLLGTQTAFLLAVPMLLDSLNVAALVGIGGLRVIEGHLTLGMLVAFQSLLASFSAPVNQLVKIGSSLQEIQGDMNRLDDVLKYPADPRMAADDSLASEARPEVQLTGRLELKNVTFGYSRLDKPLIEDFSLTLRPGERVALVGGSGSGKSTIARLVSGLFEPWSGDILFDGRPRTDIPRAVMTNSLGMVDQDIFLYSGSVRDNLTLWDDTTDETNVLQAARDAAIHDDIIVRRRGYDSEIQEGGANFSGGQRQRVEIARALVNNPTILVLDEATSALDAATEKLIDDALRRRGCTCLIVAHRLSTIRDADEIIVLDHGRVVERGTHESLKDAGQTYTRLIES